ncbi:apolipoprotein L6-like [Scyliorhinus canicula]|uniref:apolipoprotein L6-like n=1 Tax=Scyliorhinus canicula TaxID=7830 RepID=UPI0018F72FEE|nr:apolipoprotein L6-like [Scyliorhinus canicula]
MRVWLNHIAKGSGIIEGIDEGEEVGAVVLWSRAKYEQALQEVGNSYKAMDRFLILFPVLEKQIKQNIIELQTVADDIDTCHRRASIATIAGSSTSAVGGTVAMAGMLAAPFTGGISLLFTGAILAGGITTAAASVTEAHANKGHKKKVDEILVRYNNSCQDLMEFFEKAFGAIESLTKLSQEEMAAGLAKQLGLRPLSVGQNSYTLVSTLLARKTLAEMSVLQRLATDVSALLGSIQSGNVVESVGYVKKMLFGTPIMMSQGARLATATLSTAFVAWDIYSLVTESMDLRKGSTTELAQQVRKKAEGIEEKLKTFQGIFKAIERFRK